MHTTCKFEIWSHQNMIKWKRIISVWNFMGAFYCFLEWKVIKNAHEKFPNRIYSFSFYHGFINSSHVSEWDRFCAFYFLSASQIFFSLEKLTQKWQDCTKYYKVIPKYPFGRWLNWCFGLFKLLSFLSSRSFSLMG